MLSVPTDAAGIEIRGIQTMGGKEVNDVFLTDCHVPEERVLGQVDGGWMQLMAGLNVERLILAASAPGLAQRAFDDALAYVKERKQFGRPIGSFQTLKHRSRTSQPSSSAPGSWSTTSRARSTPTEPDAAA